MQVVLNGSFRTTLTGSGHNREVVALYRWPTSTGSTVFLSGKLLIDRDTDSIFCRPHKQGGREDMHSITKVHALCVSFL